MWRAHTEVTLPFHYVYGVVQYLVYDLVMQSYHSVLFGINKTSNWSKSFKKLKLKWKLNILGR